MIVGGRKLLVERAYQHFSEGDYIGALRAYQEAGEEYGRHLFEANIDICHARMRQSGPADGRALTSTPFWQMFSINELIPYRVSGGMMFDESDLANSKACVARVVFFDKDRREIAPPYPGIPLSTTVGSYFYISADQGLLLQLIPPKGATDAAIGLQRWHAEGPVRLEGELDCAPELQPKNQELTRFEIPYGSSHAEPRRQSEIKVAAILDEFTLECFRHEVNLTELAPDDWEAQIEACDPDFLFVESCWFGNQSQWGGLIYGYNANGTNRMADLLEVLKHCNRKAIPTVFWAKEDPVHYSRFAPTAKLFDYVFTTDANMVPAYQKDFGIDAEPMSFFCQPRLHNPLPVLMRQDKAAFAGSYYGEKKERCEDFHRIMNAFERSAVDVDIFDRCLERGVTHLQFPDKYKRKVVGYLEPHEMYKAYKGYRYTINLNTVKHSPTMFARRVYESLASGTPVVSNYSEGVITQFGGIVCASDSEQEIAEYIQRLKDPGEYEKITVRGIREALGRHTLSDRLEQVCRRLGIPLVPHLPMINGIYTVATEGEAEMARAQFQKQGYLRKRLVLNLKNSNLLYPYLNQNTEEEVFRVPTEFEQPLGGMDISMRVDEEYPDTYLEDIAIQTQYGPDSGAQL